LVGSFHPSQRKKSITTATLNWFDDGCCDVKYLDLWSDAPLSYSPGQANGPGWLVDRGEITIGRDDTGELFEKAADRLMRYRFYPPHILSPLGDFDLGEPRWAQVGDRIVQRIHLIRPFGLNILDVIGMVEVNQTIAEPRRYGFSYVTVATHVEVGQWSTEITWRDNGDVALNMTSVTRPASREPGRNHSLMRWLQKRAHRHGLINFKQSLLA
jgi:uncharacterized protein (UPF0548 family)